MIYLFTIGDVIVYGAQGVCKIDSTQIKQIGKDSAEYFVLKPIFSENTSLFVPVENKTLTARMQPLLTADEARNIINSASKAELIEAKDENQKREEYKNILSSNNRQRLVSLIKTINFEKETRRRSGKRLNINDEQTLKKAELLLYNELALVLGVEPQQVQSEMEF